MKTYRKLVWVPILIGTVIALAGASAVIWPEVLIKILPISLGLLALLYGAVHIALALAWKELTPASPRVVGGVAAIVVGLVFIINRALSVAFIGVLIGLFAVVSGVIRAVYTWKNRPSDGTFMYAVINSALRVIIGLLMLFNPFASMAALAVLIGVYLVFTGISIIIGTLCCKDTFDIWW
ncbi:MAG: hypothetical protein EOM30_00935 [Clostridia bacterium]|nr:hypothetical protein [Clostridia bacterium]NLS84650.1 hypothetical protein [Oscillospiraceae bacterium]